MTQPDPTTAPDPLEIAPLVEVKPHSERSIFTASNLLRESRRQRGLTEASVPEICILDPDGDVAQYVGKAVGVRTDDTWACYHTTLTRFQLAGREVGIVPVTVGAPFAVLVAEELAASGCRLLINVTSAGRIAAPPGSPHLG